MLKTHTFPPVSVWPCHLSPLGSGFPISIHGITAFAHLTKKRDDYETKWCKKKYILKTSKCCTYIYKAIVVILFFIEVLVFVFRFRSSVHFKLIFLSFFPPIWRSSCSSNICWNYCPFSHWVTLLLSINKYLASILCWACECLKWTLK